MVLVLIRRMTSHLQHSVTAVGHWDPYRPQDGLSCLPHQQLFQQQPSCNSGTFSHGHETFVSTEDLNPGHVFGWLGLSAHEWLQQELIGKWGEVGGG